MVAASASKTVMITTFRPLFFSVSSVKNSPTPKAMNASAMSEMKSVPSMIDCGTRSRQYWN